MQLNTWTFLLRLEKNIYRIILNKNKIYVYFTACSKSTKSVVSKHAYFSDCIELNANKFYEYNAG